MNDATGHLDTSAARDQILARIREARRTGSLPTSTSPDPAAQSLEAADRDAWLRRIRSEWDAIGVEVHAESSEAGVQDRLRELVAGRLVLAWDSASLPYGCAAVLEEVESVPRTADRDRIEQADLGVTGVDAAIAETGTLALVSRPGQTRLASLVPPRHVAIVRSDQVVPTLGRFLAAGQDTLRDYSCLNLVTGPSRTADIELMLTLGVHGPGELIVILGP